MKLFFLSQPIESYIYATSLLGMFSFFYITGLLDLFVFSNNFTEFFSIFLLHSNYFWTVLMFFYIYILGKLANLFVDEWANFSLRAHFYQEAKKIIKSLLYVTVTIMISGFLIASVPNVLGGIHSERIVAASNELMNWDAWIFGAYVPFWLQRFSENAVIDSALIVTYLSLKIMVSVTCIILALCDTISLRKFLISFMLAVIISVPIWYAYPAISPDEMYRRNILSLSPHEILRGDLALVPISVSMKELSASLSVSKPEKSYFFVTSFPSMHVAWGLIVVFFLVKIKKSLVYVVLPWMLLNIISAMYTLQHYAVDVVAGVAIGMVAIMMSQFLFAGKRVNNGADAFYVFTFLHQEKWCRYIQRLVNMKE